MCQFHIVQASSSLETANKVALVIIAFFNLIFAVVIFRHRNKSDAVKNEADKKMHLFKTLILDHNLKYFYEIFGNLEAELVKLKIPDLSTVRKQEINSVIGEYFILLRRNFYDAFLAINFKLYNDIKDTADSLQDNISKTVFDPGINLSHPPKFDEEINERFTETKTSIIRLLYDHRE